MTIIITILLILVAVMLGLTVLLLMRSGQLERKLMEQNTAIQVQRESAANMEKVIRDMSFGNNQQLDSMARRINDLTNNSYQQLSKMIEDLANMSSVTRDVSDIRKVLLNVKTNGNMGEYQLEAILADILAPGQYEKQFRIIPGQNGMVDFAVKMPGDGQHPVYLAIDSKNPGVSYINMVDAYESGDRAKVDNARKKLVAEIRKEAKDIHDKYILPPFTLDYAIMFMPSENMYIEAVRLGMVEILRRESSVILAGPTTMAALLSSFRVGFQSVALAERAEEVRAALESVKVQVEKYDEVLEKAERHTRQAHDDIETLRSTRIAALKRSLNSLTDHMD